MTRIGTKVLFVVALAAPLGLIAGDKKEAPEQAAGDHDSKSTRAVRVGGETHGWFAVAGNGESFPSMPKLLNGTRELESKEAMLVNRTPRKATIEAGEQFVFATDALQVEGGGFLFPSTDAAQINGNLRKTIRAADEARVEGGKKTTLKK